MSGKDYPVQRVCSTVMAVKLIITTLSIDHNHGLADASITYASSELAGAVAGEVIASFTIGASSSILTGTDRAGCDALSIWQHDEITHSTGGSRKIVGTLAEEIVH